MAVAWNPTHFSMGAGGGSPVGGGSGWAHNASGDNLLIAQVSTWVGPDVEPVLGMTFNGIALTLLPVYAFNVGRASLWYLLNPPSGTFNVAVNATGGTVAVVVNSFSGVDTTTPFGTPLASAYGVAASATPSSVSITGATTSLVVAHLGNLTDTLTPVAPSAVLGTRASSGGFHCEPAYRVGTGSPFTIGWTGYSTDSRYGCLAVEIRAAAVAGATPRMLASAGAGT